MSVHLCAMMLTDLPSCLRLSQCEYSESNGIHEAVFEAGQRTYIFRMPAKPLPSRQEGAPRQELIERADAPASTSIGSHVTAGRTEADTTFVQIMESTPAI